MNHVVMPVQVLYHQGFKTTGNAKGSCLQVEFLFMRHIKPWPAWLGLNQIVIFVLHNATFALVECRP